MGGAARTEDLTLPGFRHDVGSAVYPLGAGSPFFNALPLEEHGLEWVHSPALLAHTLDGGRAAFMWRSLDRTAEGLGRDADRYRRLLEPFVTAWPSFARHVTSSPFLPPRDPLLMARFGLRAAFPSTLMARAFRTEEAKALFMGNAAHSGIPLHQLPSAAIGLTLMIAGHAVGWPTPRGGAGALTAALASYFVSLGGEIEVNAPVESLDDLPSARAVVLAVTSRTVARLAGDRLPRRYRDRLAAWRYGPGAFKLDWALGEPIPWTAPGVSEALTVHLGGTAVDVADAEHAPWRGQAAERPFILLAQPSLFDATRAPSGRHTAWGYCHVPNGWTGDATQAIESQIERFAPGFRDCILQRRVHSPSQLQSWDANLVGGDVNGGAATLAQLFGPHRWTLRPWSTPAEGLFVCSASTPPGGGVHGMCGYHAALSVQRFLDA